jgi:hypothetical protein
MGWLSAFIGALPSLVEGLAAFNEKRAELMALEPSTHQQTIADDDAELARRRSAQEAPTAPQRRPVPVPADSSPAVVVTTLPVAAKSNPYGNH